MTKKGCYHYSRELNEEQANKLLAKIKQAQEINPEHWEVEWRYNGVDLGQGN